MFIKLTLKSGEIKRIRNFGKKSLDIIKEYLDKHLKY